MDQADVPAFLLRGAAWALAALLGTLVLAYLAGALCRRAGLKGGLPALATLLTPVALLLGASLYFDGAGVVAEGRVESKTEKIHLGSRGGFGHFWHRSLTMVVASGGGGDAVRTLVFTAEEDFDAARVGSTVKVRRLPGLPGYGRLAHHTTWSAIHWTWLPSACIALGSGFAIWLLLRRYSRTLAPLGFIGAAWVWMLYLTFPNPWGSGAAGGAETAVAEVRAVHRVNLSIGRLGLWDDEAEQPWDIVELRLVPNGSEPVVAIDDVDAGSVPGLALGAKLPVRYTPGAPRGARLLHGTRAYRRREWENLLVFHALVAAFIAVCLLTAKFARRRR